MFGTSEVSMLSKIVPQDFSIVRNCGPVHRAVGKFPTTKTPILLSASYDCSFRLHIAIEHVKALTEICGNSSRLPRLVSQAVVYDGL